MLSRHAIHAARSFSRKSALRNDRKKFDRSRSRVTFRIHSALCHPPSRTLTIGSAIPEKTLHGRSSRSDTAGHTATRRALLFHPPSSQKERLRNRIQLRAHPDEPVGRSRAERSAAALATAHAGRERARAGGRRRPLVGDLE